MTIIKEHYSPREPLTIEERVINKIAKRAEMGKKKYGTTMERTDLTLDQRLLHAQEEAMDLAVYLEKIQQILDLIPDDMKQSMEIAMSNSFKS